MGGPNQFMCHCEPPIISRGRGNIVPLWDLMFKKMSTPFRDTSLYTHCKYTGLSCKHTGLSCLIMQPHLDFHIFNS